MPRGTRCQAHKHDAIVSEEHHHIRPLSRGGLTVPANMVWLCANAHSDVHAYLALLEKGHGRVTWNNSQHFGGGVRRYAQAGWDAYAEEFLRGDWKRHAHLWETTGVGRLPITPPYSYACETRQLGRLLKQATLALGDDR